MTGSQVDYAQVFRHLPIPVLLLTPDFDIADTNLAYLQATGRTREELVGRNAFDAFPDNPSDPTATGVRDLSESLSRVLATGEPDALAFQKYDVEAPGSPGVFERRFWSPVNAPVFGPDGRVVLIAQCVEEITDKVRRFVGNLAAGELQQDCDQRGGTRSDRRDQVARRPLRCPDRYSAGLAGLGVSAAQVCRSGRRGLRPERVLRSLHLAVKKTRAIRIMRICRAAKLASES